MRNVRTSFACWRDCFRGCGLNEVSTVEVAVSPTEKFREFLATKGMRLTNERQTIVEEVFSQHEHFDAEALVVRVSQRRKGRVSRSTVYRTIAHLEEAGLLRKVARITERDVYEHDYGYQQHDHFICKQCEKLIEFPNTEISHVLDLVASRFGFRMTGHRLEAFGLCEECARPVRPRHRKLELL